MLHACDQRFDVTENLENFCELNKAEWGPPLILFFAVFCVFFQIFILSSVFQIFRSRWSQNMLYLAAIWFPFSPLQPDSIQVQPHLPLALSSVILSNLQRALWLLGPGAWRDSLNTWEILICSVGDPIQRAGGLLGFFFSESLGLCVTGFHKKEKILLQFINNLR
jgi:hypothetical protein